MLASFGACLLRSADFLRLPLKQVIFTELRKPTGCCCTPLQEIRIVYRQRARFGGLDFGHPNGLTGNGIKFCRCSIQEIAILSSRSSYIAGELHADGPTNTIEKLSQGYGFHFLYDFCAISLGK
jgi:hypothetical protein